MRLLLTLFSAFVLLVTYGATPSRANTTYCQGGLIECFFGNSSFGGSRTRSTVSWKEARKYRVGSIVVKTSERALYYTLSKDKAIRYKVGVGRQGFKWSGRSRIVNKREWPTWTPPPAMRAREKKKGRILPVTMPGGPNNPLGARALYIGGTLYRIHGTNNQASIGRAMSSGCIRMMNTDVKHLYSKVRIGTPVVVLR